MAVEAHFTISSILIFSDMTDLSNTPITMHIMALSLILQ